MRRRQFVCACGAAAASVALPGCASLVTHPVTPVNGRVALPLAAYPDLVRAGGSLRLQPSTSAEPVFVLSTGGGRFSALSSVCTHRACTVEIEGAVLRCPCHGSTYDREGAVLVGPAQQPLARYAAEVVGDALVIDLRNPS